MTRASKTNNFKLKHPTKAKYWHPQKNKNISPEDVTSFSHKVVWWQCEKGHEWQSRISHITNGHFCPYCAGQKPTKSNHLLIDYPELEKEWHPTLNGELTPYDVMNKSGKKVWWICPRGHIWQTKVEKRTRGTGCPKCDNKTSKPEIRIFAELKTIFSSIKHRDKIKGKELDLYIPELKLGIEYDGSYFHKDRVKFDIEKNDFFKGNGIEVLRIRDHTLNKINSDDIICSSHEISKKDIDNILEKIWSKFKLKANQKKQIECYLDKKDFTNKKEFNLLQSYFPNPMPNKSLAKNIKVSNEWHPTKNGKLQPENFSLASGDKVWWQCSKGHEWEATIASRTNLHSGCPFCAGQRASKENNLKIDYPEIAKFWHKDKNFPLMPEEVTSGSGKKVWWQCSKGHEFERIVKDNVRYKNSCKICRLVK